LRRFKVFLKPGVKNIRIHIAMPATKMKKEEKDQIWRRVTSQCLYDILGLNFSCLMTMRMEVSHWHEDDQEFLFGKRSSKTFPRFGTSARRCSLLQRLPTRTELGMWMSPYFSFTAIQNCVWWLRMTPPRGLWALPSERC